METTKKLKVIIVDDEKHGRDMLRKLISSNHIDFEVVGEADNVSEAINVIKEKEPDVVFLDIQLADQTSFEILEAFDEINFKIIFATAYSYYAVKAIKFSALDYLVKPIDKDELNIALERVKLSFSNNAISDRINNAKKIIDLNKPDKIALPSNNGFTFIEIDDIVSCSSDNNYTYFHLINKTSVLSCRTLKDYEDLLEGFDFFRVHNSHLINLHHVKSYIKGKGGVVLMKDGSEIEVSVRRKDLFLKQFTKL